MKNKLFAVILGAVLLFFSVNGVQADCRNKGFFGCGSGYSQCGDGSTCCSSPGECAQYPGDTSDVPDGCSFVCRVPESSNCQACLNSEGISDPSLIFQESDNGSSSNSNSNSADIHGNCGENAIDTAIGCIDVLGSQEEFLGDLLRWAIGVGSGIAFLLIVYAGFMIMTSSGNPERLKAGQELLTSALSGLILLIFSVFILNLIGVKILEIPGFGNAGGLGGASKQLSK